MVEGAAGQQALLQEEEEEEGGCAKLQLTGGGTDLTHKSLR